MSEVVEEVETGEVNTIETTTTPPAVAVSEDLQKLFDIIIDRIRLSVIEGKVYISFIIDENGEIRDVVLLRSVDKSIDNEALRVVKSMPKWKPGKQAGKTVKVQFSVPILFELQ